MEEYTKRKSTRLQGFDYSSTAMYFITICTQNRRCILSNIVGTGVLDCPRVELTPYGKIADKHIKTLDNFYDHISVKSYVIMPNHIHMLVFIKGNTNFNRTRTVEDARPYKMTANERANTSFSKFISTFKRFCNKEYGENIWQMRSNDHIIRNQEDYEKHLKYIYENPIRWKSDELYREE